MDKNEQAIHTARLTLKKVYALWRLFKPLIPARIYQHKKQQLQQAKNNLAAARDQVIIKKTLKELAVSVSHKQQKLAFLQILAKLPHCSLPDVKKDLAKAKLILRETLAYLDKINLHAWPELIASLTKSQQQFVKRLHTTKTKKRATAFHNLRKSSKKLLYQLRFFEPFWPKDLKKTWKKIDLLQEQLGFEHDLVMTKEFLKNNPALVVDPQTKKQAIKCLAEKIKKLRHKCLQLAKINLGSGLNGTTLSIKLI